jgi:hypothetical protein
MLQLIVASRKLVSFPFFSLSCVSAVPLQPVVRKCRMLMLSAVYNR